MDLPPLRNHHRRRSSVLTTSGIPFKPRLESREESSGPRASPLDGDGPRVEEQRLLSSEDTDSSDLSSVAQSDLDMDHLSSDDDLNDDEETGLTAQQRSARRRRRRKQRRRLDARIADVKASKKPGLGLALADKDVIKRLLTNAALISLWYLFSLSISIVSLGRMCYVFDCTMKD